MSLIIAATDFSDVAQNAVRYACHLAAAQKTQVLIIHSYIIPVMFSDVPMPASVVNDAQTDAEESMQELVNALSAQYPTVGIKGSVVYGDVIDILDEYEETTKPMMIVVGNSAGEKNTWIDNTLREEFTKLKYPVLAVPPHVQYKPVGKICFAFDNKHTGNEKALHQLTGIANALGAELHVLNVQPDTHNQDNNVNIDAAAQNILATARTSYHIQYDVQNVDKAIENFVASNGQDWLALIPRKHSFFEGLFHKSHTKAIAQNAKVPVVALHEV